MVDYPSLAAVLGVPAEQVDRIIPALRALESVFRPLAASLRLDEEPATTFCAAEDGE